MIRTAFIASLVALSLSRAVAASPARPVAEAAPAASAAVTARGRVVARLYTANAGLSPARRAELANERLAALGAGPVTPIEIETRPLKESVGVYLKGKLLLLATPAEAATRDLTPAALADRWATLLRKVLGDPSNPSPPPAPRIPGSPKRRGEPGPNTISASPTRSSPSPLRGGGQGEGSPPPTLRITETRLTLPLGESRTVAVTGSGATPTVDSTSSEIVEARLAPGSRSGQWELQLRGLVAGKATVRLRVPPADGQARPTPTAEVAVQVMPYAARPHDPVEILVTGRPAPGAWVRQQVMARRDESLATEPGARVRWTSLEGAAGGLAAGESRTYTASARVTAPGCLPATVRGSVVARNRALPGRETALLLYSNNPERVTTTGSLYSAPIDEDIPARLLYHHQNGSGRPFAFRVEIENPNDGPAEVQVIEGAAGPTFNTVLVGHLAARRFGESWPEDVGVILTIPPGRGRALVRARVPDGDTVSGILGLRCLSGGRVRVRVVAEEEAGPVERAVAAAVVEPVSEHVYPSPRKEVNARYRVGETWAFIPVGKKPIPARDGDRKLEGNYGVLYEIAVRVENPTDRERTIQVALSADAGPARGIFWIEDRLIEAPELTATDGVLASFRLGPGESRDVPIRTIPVAGSAYPARIVVRATPLPPTPRAVLTDSPAEMR